MSWSLIKSIQNDTDLRLILPFGLNLRIGDIVSVSRKDGSFTSKEGSVRRSRLASISSSNPAKVSLSNSVRKELLQHYSRNCPV
jgi:hypothetical protein